jgi:hypothetical protein
METMYRSIYSNKNYTYLTTQQKRAYSSKSNNSYVPPEYVFNIMYSSLFLMYLYFRKNKI